MRMPGSCAGLLVTGVAAVGAAAPRLDDAKLKAIDGIAAAAVGKDRLPGAVIVAGIGDRVAFSGVYGNRQVAPAAVPMTADTLFDLASCSKIVGTTAAVMLLVDDGRLRLEDPVGKYLPEWSGTDRAGVEIRHLLNHTSGLPAYTAAEAIRKKHGPGPNPDAVVDTICGLGLAAPPGGKVEYS